MDRDGIRLGRRLRLRAAKSWAEGTRRRRGRNPEAVQLGPIDQRPLEDSGKRRASDMKSTITNLITLIMIFAFACVIRLGLAFEMMR
jgi:hypothetical protein